MAQFYNLIAFPHKQIDSKKLVEKLLNCLLEPQSITNLSVQDYFGQFIDESPFFCAQFDNSNCVTPIQAIPGNDQNASPTNQKTAGSKLDSTS